MKRIVIALSVAAVLAAGAVTAWIVMSESQVATASGAGHVVSRADLEQHARDDFGEDSEDAPDSVSCPEELRAKKDATVRCTAVFDGRSKTMDISADAVEGDEVSLGFAVFEKR
ncbi:DUF4333 domain-containing protein [Streptomyces axinellae]|uniref:DUF4333 domain-containing protein n=1 Tax=Streptomyces axinellae TaxID=552788 RepID=A0ABP6C470_9ACTN